MNRVTLQISRRATMRLLVGALSLAALAAVSSPAIADDWQPLSEKDAKIVFVHPGFRGAASESHFGKGGFSGVAYAEFRMFRLSIVKIAVISYEATNRDDVYIKPSPIEEMMAALLGESSISDVSARGTTSGLLGDYNYVFFTAGTRNCVGFNHRWGATISARVPSQDIGQNQTDVLTAAYCRSQDPNWHPEDRLAELISSVGVKGYKAPEGYASSAVAAKARQGEVNYPDLPIRAVKNAHVYILYFDPAGNLDKEQKAPCATVNSVELDEATHKDKNKETTFVLEFKNTCKTSMTFSYGEAGIGHAAPNKVDLGPGNIRNIPRVECLKSESDYGCKEEIYVSIRETSR